MTTMSLIATDSLPVEPLDVLEATRRPTIAVQTASRSEAGGAPALGVQAQSPKASRGE